MSRWRWGPWCSSPVRGATSSRPTATSPALQEACRLRPTRTFSSMMCRSWTRRWSLLLRGMRMRSVVGPMIPRRGAGLGCSTRCTRSPSLPDGVTPLPFQPQAVPIQPRPVGGITGRSCSMKRVSGWRRKKRSARSFHISRTSPRRMSGWAFCCSNATPSRKRLRRFDELRSFARGRRRDTSAGPVHDSARENGCHARGLERRGKRSSY